MLAEPAVPIDLFSKLVTGCSLAIACAVLSVFVVSRRWAFIGEGISHSGFGGAGTVWLLMLTSKAIEHSTWATYLGVVVFCLLTALAIGYVTRNGRVNSDAAIGIFVVASLAWGFLAQKIFLHFRHYSPVGFDALLFGEMDVRPEFAIGAAMVCAAVIVTLVLLNKEIIAYCFDPMIAEASGVRAGFIHYLLMVLVALTIVVGVFVVGSVLVTALLVLPGATAMLFSRRLGSSIAAALLIGLSATLGGIAIHYGSSFIPPGPPIVLILFGEFVIAYTFTRVMRM